MDERLPSHISDDGILWVPSDDLPTELTLISFRRDLLLMPSIMVSRFPRLERSRPVRLMNAFLELTEDEMSLLDTKQVLTVANGGFVHILPDSDRLAEAESEARAVVERALSPANPGMQSRSASGQSLVVISYANQDRAYADLLAGHMRACSIYTWLYVHYGLFLSFLF
jgi:hypothetical protein